MRPFWCPSGAVSAQIGLISRLGGGSQGPKPLSSPPTTSACHTVAAGWQQRSASRRPAGRARASGIAGGSGAAAAAAAASSSGPAPERCDFVGGVPAHPCVRGALALLRCPEGLQASHPLDLAAQYTPSGAAAVFVYCLTLKHTGRYYIGCTKDPKQRFRSHASQPPRRMRADVNRYKPFAAHFELSVLAEAGSVRDAQLLEEYFIWKWDATGGKGYNTREAACDPGPRLW